MSISPTSGLRVAKWIVSGTAGFGTHTTIAAAITAASSGDTIFVRDGTYTENLTLKAGVDITALGGDSNEPNVTIIGKCSYTGTGIATISSIKLQTNSDFAVAVTGSAASVLVLVNCTLTGSNNTIISYTTSNAASEILLTQCNMDLSTTGIAHFAMSSTGILAWDGVVAINSGGSTTNSTQSAGTLTVYRSTISCDITTSGTGMINMRSSNLGRGAGNTTALTHGSNAANCQLQYCNINTGTASSVSISAGATLLMDMCETSSSNTNSITGAGALIKGVITSTFGAGGSAVINVTTQTAAPSNVGSISFDGGTNTLSTYTVSTWTPTVIGAVAGVTTYTVQQGYYTRIGNQVTIWANVQGSAATGTGDATFGSFPFTIKSQTGFTPTAPVLISAPTWAWPVGGTAPTMQATNNTITARIFVSGTAAAGGYLQMTNGAFAFQFTLTYQI